MEIDNTGSLAAEKGSRGEKQQQQANHTRDDTGPCTHPMHSVLTLCHTTHAHSHAQPFLIPLAHAYSHHTAQCLLPLHGLLPIMDPAVHATRRRSRSVRPTAFRPLQCITPAVLPWHAGSQGREAVIIKHHRRQRGIRLPAYWERLCRSGGGTLVIPIAWQTRRLPQLHPARPFFPLFTCGHANAW